MSDRFSPLFKKALGEYVSYLIVIFEISDWRVTLLGEYPDGDDAGASIKCLYGRRVAELRLCKDFLEQEYDSQRHYLTHEVAHILTDGCDNVIENGLSIVLGMPAYTVLQEAWKVQLEYLTDGLAYIVSDLVAGRARHDRLWHNVLRAERDELPIPDPADRVTTLLVPADPVR